jgi:hypothetical protein
MPRSARVQHIIEEAAGLTPAEREELEAELRAERERLAAGQALLDDWEAEHGPIPEDEVARVRREWPRD